MPTSTSQPGTNYPFKRKLVNFWLNPKYQIRYLLLLVGSGIVLFTIQVAVFYNFNNRIYGMLLGLSPKFRLMIMDQFWRNAMWLGAASALLLLIICMFAIVLSHRAAGPVYHFKKVFEAVKNGDRSARIHLRRRDHFQDVAKAFNEMMDKLNSTGSGK